ncbi:MAG: TIGR03086 family metal-binding protein [Actinomycetota bacterium]
MNSTAPRSSTFVTVEYTDGSPLAPDDPRGAMARSVQAARAVVGRLDGDAAGAPSPCPDWTALDVANHLVAVLDRTAASAAGVDLATLPILADHSVDAVADALGASALAVHAAWSDDAVLGRQITVPWGAFPGAAVIGMYAVEILIHTWDLAAALGLDVTWPDDDARVGRSVLEMSIPADGRGDDALPFSEVVPTADDAPPIERLVAWMGRDPEAWRPSST